MQVLNKDVKNHIKLSKSNKSSTYDVNVKLSKSESKGSLSFENYQIIQPDIARSGPSSSTDPYQSGQE